MNCSALLLLRVLGAVPSSFHYEWTGVNNRVDATQYV
jgi:hypothetical protein